MIEWQKSMVGLQKDDGSYLLSLSEVESVVLFPALHFFLTHESPHRVGINV